MSQSELGDVLSMLDAVRAGHRRAAVVEGDAGIGKSHLLAQAMRHARAVGLGILVCDGQDSRRLQLDIAAALDSGAPLLVVVDDAHRCERATAGVLMSSYRKAVRRPLALLLATRRYPRSALADRLLDTLPIEIRLQPLDRPATGALVAEALQDGCGTPTAGTRLRRMLAGCGGNPAYALGLVTGLRGAGRLTGRAGRAEPVGDELPEALIRVVGRHLRALPEATIELLELAAVFHRRFSAAELSHTAGMPLGRLVIGLRPAQHAGFLRADDGLLTFSHEVVRGTLLAGHPASTVHALRGIEAAKPGLTRSETDIARLVAAGLSNPQIAERLFISRHTVESHLKHIYAKLCLSSRTELVATVLTTRLLSPNT